MAAASTMISTTSTRKSVVQISAVPFLFILTLMLSMINNVCPSSSLRLPAMAPKNESSVGVDMEIIHRYAPGSPYHNPNATLLDRAIDLIRRSNLREQNYGQRVRTARAAHDATALTKNADGDLLAVFGIGTPAVRTLAVLDTGSDIVWVQCEPCKENSCFKHKPVIYNPRKSRSYTLIRCSDIRCDYDDAIHCSYTDRVTCSYIVRYEDDSFTAGDVAIETFTFRYLDKVYEFLFGCGHENVGKTFNEEMSGVCGLGKGVYSLPNQLKVSKMSFCFPRLDSDASGVLRLGSTAVFSNTRIKMYPRTSEGDDYLLPLEGISVDDVRLKYPEGLFVPKENSSAGGILLDSGTYVTRLFLEAYDALIDAVAEAIGDEYTRSEENVTDLDLCYEVESWENFRKAVPKITFHFRGGDLVWKDYGTFYEVLTGTWCLFVMQARIQTAFFGAFQMQGYAVGIDLAKDEVSFTSAPPTCFKH